MIKVGILPTSQINEKDNPYNDIYTFQNIISKNIYEAGAIPIGILLNDGKLDYRSLEMCDALLIGGGKKIEPYFLEVINYSINHNKPLLGLCLGMQSIGVYSYLETLLKKENKELNLQNFYETYKNIKENNIQFLIPIEGHYNEKITRSNYNKNKHEVNVIKNTKLYSIFEKDAVDVVSLHRYAVNKYGDSVLVNCTSRDIVEGLEYKNKDLFILGVQWHPELENANKVLFEALIEEARKRKKE